MGDIDLSSIACPDTMVQHRFRCKFGKFGLGQAFPLYLLPHQVSLSSGSALRGTWRGQLEFRSFQLRQRALACS